MKPNDTPGPEREQPKLDPLENRLRGIESKLTIYQQHIAALQSENKELRHLWIQNEEWLVKLKGAFDGHIHDVDRDGIGLVDTSLPETDSTAPIDEPYPASEQQLDKGKNTVTTDSTGELEQQLLSAYDRADEVSRATRGLADVPNPNQKENTQ